MSTYYVASSGDDLNGDGSSANPYQTIDHASHVAGTGDIIYIAKGTNNETIIPERDGVTYTGERGPNGEWQTIIDPSVGGRIKTSQWGSNQNQPLFLL